MHIPEPYDRPHELELEATKKGQQLMQTHPFRPASKGRDSFDPDIFKGESMLPKPTQPTRKTEDSPKPFIPAAGFKTDKVFSQIPYVPENYDELQKRLRREARGSAQGLIFKPSSGPRTGPVPSVINNPRNTRSFLLNHTK